MFSKNDINYCNNGLILCRPPPPLWLPVFEAPEGENGVQVGQKRGGGLNNNNNITRQFYTRHGGSFPKF